MANKNLQHAKAAKNDEFYTQLSDVAEELRHYKKHFQGKVVLCNCDDPTYSAFWKYFHLNFSTLGLKKLISTHYDKEKSTYKMEYEGGNDNDVECGVKTPLEGNGDFRNKECLDLMDEADIVVTNPPFSMFRVYIATIIEHEKKFLIIGNQNAITYKEVFPLLKNNDVWIGYNHVKEFYQPDGTIKKFGNIQWFTNLDIEKRHEKLILWKKYNPDEYPTYDNYDAINVDKVANIPVDYCESWEVTKEEFERLDSDMWEVVRNGNREDIETAFIIPKEGTELREMLHTHVDGYKKEIEKELGKQLIKYWYETGVIGVPITFLDKYNPEQFEIKNPEFEIKNPEEVKKVLDKDEGKNTILAADSGQRTAVSLRLVQTDGMSTERESMLEYLSGRYCNGLIGVPITFIDKYNPKQFVLFGATESEGKGFSNGLWIENSGIAQPLVRMSKMYKRVFIRQIL